MKDFLKRLVFKKPSPSQAIQTQSAAPVAAPKGAYLDNPYTSARRTWNEHVGSIVTAKQIGYIFGILGMLIGLAGVGGMIHIGSQSKFIPYIVEVDKLHATQSYGQIGSGKVDDPKILASRVSTFIADSRLVTPDVKLQRDAVFRTYSVLAPNDPGTQKMNEWLNSTADRSPFARAAKETVSVEVTSVLQQSPESWQVDWIETTRDRQGVMKGKPVTMRALVSVYLAEPNTNVTEQEMWMNPIRLFVRDFTWSKQI